MFKWLLKFWKEEDTVGEKSKMPSWVDYARTLIGTKEIKGRRHNKRIVGFWKSISRPYRDDEVPWCGGFVGHVMKQFMLKIPKGPEGARNWLKFGVKLEEPIPGCVVVFWRGKKNGWAGHVAIVTGVTPEGNLMCVGGNQADMVSEVPFSKLRVLGYRWPQEVGIPKKKLKVVKTDKKLSTRED